MECKSDKMHDHAERTNNHVNKKQKKEQKTDNKGLIIEEGVNAHAMHRLLLSFIMVWYGV
jgi:hypothetical protein